MSDPITGEVDPYAKVTNRDKAGDKGVENKLELLVICAVAPKSNDTFGR